MTNRSDAGGGDAGATHVEHDGWILVETLDDAEAPRVLCVDGRHKDWTALSRATQTKRIGDASRDLVRRVAGNGRAALLTLPAAAATTVIRAFPVPGPARDVHGVQIHVGTDSTSSTPRPWAAGYEWSDRSRVFDFTNRMWDVIENTTDSRTTITTPEMFELVIDTDYAMNLVTALLDASPDTRWTGPLTIASRQGPMPVRTAIRTVATSDGAGTISRGISYQVLGDEVPPSTPSMEALALRSVTRDTRTAIALVDFARVRLVRWLTDPIEGIQWKGMVDQRDTPHPDDIPRVAAAVKAIARDHTREQRVSDVRLRRLQGGWTVVDIRGTMLPDTDGERFLMVEFRIVGATDDPDPVPSSDPGWQARTR